MINCSFPKIRYFCVAKMVANQENIWQFSDSAPSKKLIKTFGA